MTLLLDEISLRLVKNLKPPITVSGSTPLKCKAGGQTVPLFQSDFRIGDIFMGFYRDHIYSLLVRRMGNPEPIQKVREQVVPLAQGTVLEIGVGTGANFVHYRPAQVTKLYALEPNPGMIRRARTQQQRVDLDVEYIDLPGERVPLDDSSIDTVVSTFTICTIDAVEDAIGEIRRVLKPGDRLIFIELGESPDPSVRLWQKRLDPIVYRIYAGLSLTRDVPCLLINGGFRMMKLNKGYLAAFPRALTYCWWDSAAVT